jgi:hypothetical protein
MCESNSPRGEGWGWGVLETVDATPTLYPSPQGGGNDAQGRRRMAPYPLVAVAMDPSPRVEARGQALNPSCVGRD